MAVNYTDIAALVEQTVEGMGYEFVEFETLPRGLLRVTIDKDGTLTTDDCEVVSNQLTYLFAAEDVDYERLEVSSPGVERPLKKAQDWRRFAGSPAHVELAKPLFNEFFSEAGRRKFDGKIVNVEDGASDPRITFLFTDEKPARTPREAAQKRQAARKNKAEQAPKAITVTFNLSDVLHAWLLAELNFKGM